MLTPQKNIHASVPGPEKIPILLVSPHQEDQSALRQILNQASWGIGRCETAASALKQIQENQQAVVVCERDLPDGTWRTILEACEARPRPPLVLVMSRQADECLWAEVLNLGGYDVLLKPFDPSEVTRVIAMASRQWSGRLPKQPAATASSPPISALYA